MMKTGTQTTTTTSHSALMMNQGQAEFKQLVVDCIHKLCKHCKNVGMMAHSGQGYVYQDYVITIKASHDKRSCEVYRNRTGMLVFSMENMETTAINWQYIFIDEHMKSKIKEIDG